MRELERRFPPDSEPDRRGRAVRAAHEARSPANRAALSRRVAETLRGRGKSLLVDEEALDMIVEQATASPTRALPEACHRRMRQAPITSTGASAAVPRAGRGRAGRGDGGGPRS